MTRKNVRLDDLVECRERIIKQMPGLLREDYKDLIISILNGMPRWDKLPFQKIGDYPGIRWKLLNINKMSEDRIKEEIRLIEAVFGSD